MSFYLYNKEEGMTSRDAFLKLRKIEGVNNGGFAGVLDPFAEGLLIIGTNKDTKFFELFEGFDKTYTGVIEFGKRTDTLDNTGEIIAEDPEFKLNFKSLVKVVKNKFMGKIQQVPPKYSNIKVNGDRARNLVRKGIEFTLEPIEREIKSFEIDQIDENTVSFKIAVSCGTYIRSIARDLGIAMGSHAYLTKLNRIAIGDIKTPEVEFIKVNREDILPIKFYEVSKPKIRDLLDGKIVDLDIEDQQAVVQTESRMLWIKRANTNKYKIHKNIV